MSSGAPPPAGRHRRALLVLPRRWVVERTFAWLMNSRRLVWDYETLPAGFVPVSQQRLLVSAENGLSVTESVSPSSGNAPVVAGSRCV